MEKLSLLRGAEPYFFPGNEVGCLLIHGFTGSPFELRWMGEHLHEQGYTVYGLRLAGHGTDPKDLARVHWRDWAADALAGYKLLSQQCERVFVIGLSMGGALTLWLASQVAVDGLVAMSTPYSLDRGPWPLKRLLPVARMVLPMFSTLPKAAVDPQMEAFQQRVREEQIQRGEEPHRRPSYEDWVVGAVPQLMTLLKEMRTGLPAINAPALLVHSKSDRTVPMANFEALRQAIGSEQVETLILEKSAHPVAEDMEHPLVFEAAANFIAGQL